MVNVKRYTINYTKLIQQRVPEPLRQPVIIAFLSVLAFPFIGTYNLLLNFRTLVIYKLQITPQVVYLEKMLNDRYDTSERRIYITDGKEYPALFIYTKSEAKPTFFFKKDEVGFLSRFLYLKNETGQFTFDFVVHVPAVVSFDTNELTALVNFYKLAGKIFKIQIH